MARALTVKQLEKLRDLARREQEHSVLARGMLDAREHTRQRIATAEQRVMELKRSLPAHSKGDICDSIEAQIAALEREIKAGITANDERNAAATEHVEVTSGLSATIDAICEHVGTTRAALALDFWRSDSGGSTFSLRGTR